jgi:DNA-binding NtrC family response regulator/tetratricopeptide (TPR) repeat protein
LQASGISPNRRARWTDAVDPDRFALALLAVQTERYLEARQRLADILSPHGLDANALSGAPGGVTPRDGSGAVGSATIAAHARTAGPSHRHRRPASPADLPPIPCAFPDAPTLRDACVLMAEALYMSGRHQECLDFGDRAVAAGGLPADDVYMELLRGWVLQRRQHVHPARQIATRNLRRCRRKGLAALQAAYLHLLGTSEYHLGHMQVARNHLRDSLALYRQAGHYSGEIEAILGSAHLEKVAGSLTATLAMLERGLALARRHGLRHRECRVLQSLGQVLTKIGRAREAIPMTERQRHVYSQRASEHGVLNFDLGLAKAHIVVGDHPAARRVAADVLERALRLRLPREEELALEVLGDVALCRRQLATARRYHERALAVTRRMGAHWDLVAGLERRLGEDRLAEGHPGAAAALLRRAIRRAQRCQERYEEGVAGRLLAQALRELGRWEAAHAACGAAIDLLRNFGARLELAHAHLEMARVRMDWRAARNRHPGLAEPRPGTAHKDVVADEIPPWQAELTWSDLREALAIFRDLEDSRGAQETSDLLAELRAQQRGRVDDAQMESWAVAGRCPPGPWPPLDVKATAEAERAPEPESGSEAGPEPRALAGIATPVFIARSRAMRGLLKLLAPAARSDEPILLLGETGTGKEVLARLLHARSRRATAPFVAVNCAAVPESLFEREFFGHRKGSFTSAEGDRQGLCALAHRGTLVLDEVGELPLPVQAKLLRLLQEGTYRRLGDPVEQAADLRLMAATNAEPPRLVEEGRFRRDLYFRLRVIELRLPPLRNRREDIEPLLEHFLAEGASSLPGGSIARRPLDLLDPEALAALHRYRWPGNVRELRTLARRLLLQAEAGRRLGVADLPAEIVGPGERLVGMGKHLDLTRHLEETERRRIRQALMQCGGNRSRAAELLGIGRGTLYRKMERLGIEQSGDRARRS